MNLFKKILLLPVLCCLQLAVLSQTDSCNLRISLLTASPGEELYSIFGHSALRVTNVKAHTDIIYNYGSFQFDDHFYYKFVKGGEQLQYYVAVEKFEDFMYEYRVFNRNVIEQILWLSCDEKEKLSAALQENALEANKYYRYDFLFDNCSTRLRDMVASNTSPPAGFKRILPAKPPTFRDLIYEYLNRGKQYWSKLGIDLLLGSRMDRPVKNEEAMFLPDYLMKGFDSALTKEAPLVQSKEMILPSTPSASLEPAWLRPLGAGFLLLGLGVILSFTKTRWAAKILPAFDRIFFFLLGATGLLLLFMWFGTDHALCANNYNLLWAMPTHLPISFLLSSKKPFVQRYFLVCTGIYLILLLAWAFLPQGMNPAFLPIAALAGWRCYERFRKQDAI